MGKDRKRKLNGNYRYSGSEWTTDSVDYEDNSLKDSESEAIFEFLAECDDLENGIHFQDSVESREDISFSKERENYLARKSHPYSLAEEDSTMNFSK